MRLQRNFTLITDKRRILRNGNKSRSNEHNCGEHEINRGIEIGRMGLPYHQKNINLISIALDAPQDVISALSGKIGNLDGVSVTIAFSK